MPTKETTYKEEIIKMPEFQSSTPTFGQSTNPLDLNMGVQNRFTGREGTKIFDNLIGGNNQEDVVFEIPFDIKGLMCFTQYINDKEPTMSDGAVRGMCTGFSTKPFNSSIEQFSLGGLLGNCSGQFHTLQNITKVVRDLTFIQESVSSITTDLIQYGDNPVEDLSYFDRTPTTGELLTGASYSLFTLPCWNPSPFVAQGLGCASDSFYPVPTDANFRVYPVVREDRRVTLRCDIKDGRRAFCVFTFL